MSNLEEVWHTDFVQISMKVTIIIRSRMLTEIKHIEILFRWSYGSATQALTLLARVAKKSMNSCVSFTSLSTLCTVEFNFLTSVLIKTTKKYQRCQQTYSIHKFNYR